MASRDLIVTAGQVYGASEEMTMEPDPLVSLLPFLIVTVIFFVFSIPISRRKGEGIGYAALCLVPLLSPFILLYLVSLTDQQVLNRLAALEGKPH